MSFISSLVFYWLCCFDNVSRKLKIKIIHNPYENNLQINNFFFSFSSLNLTYYITLIFKEIKLLPILPSWVSSRIILIFPLFFLQRQHIMPAERQQQDCARSLSFERFSSKIHDIEKILLLIMSYVYVWSTKFFPLLWTSGFELFSNFSQDNVT